MALSVVRQILLRAAMDSEFRSALMERPDSILDRYNLVDEEKQSLRGLTEDQIADAVSNPDLVQVSMSDIRI